MAHFQSGSDGPLFLGIEGGGTRTVAIMADAEGRLIHRIEAGPANLKLLSDIQLAKRLTALARQFPRPAAVSIGLAGLRSQSDRSRLRKAAERVWPGVPCHATADLETAMAVGEKLGASPRQPRVLVLSGTGSCCYGRAPGGKVVKVGGWGHLLGDQGSAYQIGLHALQAIVSRHDRDGLWPALGAQMLRALHFHHPDDLIAWAQAAEKKDVAALAREVFEAWERRDKFASAILEQAAENLVRDAAACAGRLVRRGTLVQFIFAGSVLVRQPRFASLVSGGLARLWPEAEFAVLDRESAWGAVRLAQELWTHEAPEEVLPGKRRTRGANQPNRRGPRPPGDKAGGQPPRPVPIPKATGLSPTEARNPKSTQLHRLPLEEAIALMLSEEGQVPGILLAERKTIESCIRLIVQAFRRGGRLFYVGAGTSGRIGTLDASECPPTFRTAPDQVQGIMAGGQKALWQSIEGAEDDAGAGAEAIRFRGVRSSDVVVGIAASGRTPFVWGALHEAKRVGARTILVCFNPNLKFLEKPDRVLAPDLGPEVLTGSTRLKAGTATKLLLNLFTTLSMVRLGKVVSNLMVDLNPSNRKLRERAVRIVCELTGADETAALGMLEQSGWRVKEALRAWLKEAPAMKGPLVGT